MHVQRDGSFNVPITYSTSGYINKTLRAFSRAQNIYTYGLLCLAVVKTHQVTVLAQSQVVICFLLDYRGHKGKLHRNVTFKMPTDKSWTLEVVL